MTLYGNLLGARFEALPAQVRAFHNPVGVTRWAGKAKVRRGHHPLARLTCRMFGFPSEGDAVPLTLTVTPLNGAERWDRSFGGVVMSSVQRVRQGTLIEHLGPMRIYMTPVIKGNRFSVKPVGWSFLGLPLPSVLMPTSENYETEVDNRFHFDVAIAMPLIGPIVSYRGYLEAQDV
ncbi:MAG: DUF4166 domain-containing protein [Pseudomonadota bacterium]